MLAPDALPVTSRQLTAQPTETHNSLLADMIAGPAITSDVTDEQYPHNYKQTGVTGNPETRIPEICSQTDYAIVNSLTVRRKSRKFCLAPGCKHIAVPGNPLSCRLFYAKSERKDVWLSKLGLKNKCKVVCICKCHFRVSDFSRMHGKLTLDPSAVPVITSSDRLTAANDHIAKLEKELACTKQVLEKIRSHLTECQVASMMGKPVTKWNEEDLEIGSKIRKKVTTTAYDLIRSFLPLPSIGSLNAHYNKKRRRLEENSQPEADHESGGQSMPHETHTLSPADMDLMTAAVRATQC